MRVQKLASLLGVCPLIFSLVFARQKGYYLGEIHPFWVSAKSLILALYSSQGDWR
jgi:hypothetical protein